MKLPTTRAETLTGALHRRVSRRGVLKLGALALVAQSFGWGAAAPGRPAAPSLSDLDAELGVYPFALPELPYPYDALAPAIDAETMRLHHEAHHRSYVERLNAALADVPEFHGLPFSRLLIDLTALPTALGTAVRNHGGGHLNHTLWWGWLEPGGPAAPPSALRRALEGAFGSTESFRERLLGAAAAHFGSGWAWLVLDAAGRLRVRTTRNQDSPVMDGELPVLGVDVWEHAYYLTYRNRRGEYLENLWRLVNWDAVARAYERAEAASKARGWVG
ncbi:superoxide dismutase [Truepera radiovictrix]|uniref:superoxide dismutase n=1 Tax=Truepera radiovictrix (strain DSM 17093 / CIP 108686 / LMG 22925 / RQ-24) TaxID=649638 RepID=D7CXL9_TRURR|nr:superoxide dismutase [Truepera radiovictrix]ADI14621.1 Superoxide dismutase [Truepera radiovictrix DSM 17093]WMT56829.1 superoxide dismutase [Truepera radiovictrix]